METIRGKTHTELGIDEFRERLAGYQHIHLDVGTGDGRYVRYLAARHPDRFVIGVDTCRENLREHSRADLPNALFVIAAAQALPRELHGLVSHLTINFPWGSLLQALVKHDATFLNGLTSLAGRSASLDLCLNGGALAEAGWMLDAGMEEIRQSLRQAGWQVKASRLLDAAALRAFPSTWARRLAHGRDPRAILISGSLSSGAQ